METSSVEDINPRYTASVSDEPKQLLQPILGYTREPLLPLEEACEPILDIVPNLPAHIWVAKQNSKNPLEGLSQDESAAIHLYTMEWDGSSNDERASLYSHLNRTLKQVDRTKLRPWFRYLKLFLTALAKLPYSNRPVVWRGVRKNHSDDYPPGAEITWWAFSSCTASLSVLDSELYLGKVGTRTIFSIETINARSIRSHSHFQTEDELLLLPGSYFEVKSRLNPAPDLYIVHLQQKIPPHVLLEAPFKGAELLPSSEIDQSSGKKAQGVHTTTVNKSRPWFKNKKIILGASAILVAAIIIAVVLGAVLGSRNKNSSVSPLPTTASPSPTNNGSNSVPTAFYPFDGNTLDLYSLRNGLITGGLARYVQGYIAYGQAIVLNQSTATQIVTRPAFNLTSNSSFTIEGFFMLLKAQMNAILVQLSPNSMFNLSNGILAASLGSNVTVHGTLQIPLNEWRHLSLTYNATLQTATISVDGVQDGTQSSIKLDNSLNSPNATMIVGAGYQGCIDQLSISLKAKSQSDILWDATTAAYYPLDGVWLIDRGPNDINATANAVTPVYGWLLNALNFNHTDAYFQADGFTGLGTPNHSFSVALWVRLEGQSGVFLTISNPSTCLLALGIENDEKKIVAFLPNATTTGQSINMPGIPMPVGEWVNVVFTWSPSQHARLYTSTVLQAASGEATLLSNTRGANSSLPMTVTLGQYHGAANCQGIQGINTSQNFVGSLDEFYVFTRELQADDLNKLTQVPST